MGDIYKSIVKFIPLITFYPLWAQLLFLGTLLLIIVSLVVGIWLFRDAIAKKSIASTQQHETANADANTAKKFRITPEKLDSLISTVSEYKASLQQVRDSMNKQGTQISQEDLSGFRIDYEKHIRPLADALDMNEPGEKDWHGYKLQYDNPADLAMKEFSFFHVNLSLRFLSSLMGRLEYLRENPELLGNPASNHAIHADR